MNKEMNLQKKRNYCIAWEKSGKSRLAFCKANGISSSTFHGWYTQYQKDRSRETLFTPMEAELPVPIIKESPSVKSDFLMRRSFLYRFMNVHWFLLFRGFVMQLQLYGKKIWVYRSAIDFRRSIDGLTRLIESELKQNPKEGVYLFYNRHRDKIKGLSWHKNGFVLFYKRMESGRFSMYFNKTSGVMEVNIDEFGWLLAGLEWQKMRGWKERSYDKFS